MKLEPLLILKMKFRCAQYHTIVLCPMFFCPLSLKEGCIFVVLPEKKFYNGLEFLLEICLLSIKIPEKHFDTHQIKIWNIYGLAIFNFWVLLYGRPWVPFNNFLTICFFYLFIKFFIPSFVLLNILVLVFRISLFLYHNVLISFIICLSLWRLIR